MSDSEEKPPTAPAPETQPEEHNVETTRPDAQPEDRLLVARRFLEDDEVRLAPREKKVEFLRSKGVDESEIETLLSSTSAETEETTKSTPHESKPVSTRSTPSPKQTTQTDRPPIVTYPEFLAKPARPPPLVTTNRLLHTLNAFAVLSTVLYGASKFVVGPMVENLTAARLELHDTTSSKLDGLVAKLEQTVSVIPPSSKDPDADSAASAADADASSEADDPSEMFHRDMGTQTSLPSTPFPSGLGHGDDNDDAKVSASQRQADRLTSLARSLSALKDEYRTQSEDLDDVKTLIDVFRDDLDTMTYGQSDFVGGYDMYSRQRRNEPEDEIKKVRDNIRRVKGVLLSTRNFPASTNRR